MDMLDYGIDPETDPHRGNPEPHCRLYHPHASGPTVVCVQSFDYFDYDPARFMTKEAYETENAAKHALWFLHRTLRGDPQMRLDQTAGWVEAIAAELEDGLDDDEIDRQLLAEQTLARLRTLIKEISSWKS